MIFKTIQRLICMKGLSLKAFEAFIQHNYRDQCSFWLPSSEIKVPSRNFASVFMTLVVLFCLLPGTSNIHAQQSISLINGRTPFEKGLELYEKQKFSGARHFFEETIKQTQVDYSLYRSEAQYYIAMCAIQLYNDDAEILLTKYIAENSQSPRINEACYAMAKFEYGKKKYREAVRWFKKVEKNNLSHEDQPEYYFKSGYSFYMNGDTVNARRAFFEIKDIDTKFTSPALYYYSHIAYASKNYETALEGFKRLTDDETFAPIVPYYITQIYYLQENYDQLIQYAPSVLEKSTEKRMPEMARLIGEAYYRKGMYSEAIPYLEKYRDKTTNLTREDKYELGYAYYQVGRIDDAIIWFEKSSMGENIMGQSALYHLGDCFLKKGDKSKARAAFSSASTMDFNKDIKEDALFNYAKLTYELSYSPFNEALRAFYDYLTLYPNTKRTDEVYNYLVTAFLSTRNYKDALTYIQKIRNKDEKIKKAYQRIAFFRGIELFNNVDYTGALAMFDLSLTNGSYDVELKARTLFWRSEALFKTNDITSAEDGFKNFIETSGSYGLEEYKMAHYSLAYCSFNQKKYPEAASWFRKYLSLTSEARTAVVADACNRVGDCFFVAMDYPNAIKYYDKSIQLKLFDADYALFQKGFSQGLLANHEQKIVTMNSLISSFPKSSYVDDALYEIGNSYLKLKNPEKALGYFQKIVTDFPSGAMVSKASVQMALVYYNQNKYQLALETYKKVVSSFPGTTESLNALAGIKNVYVEMNDVDSYFTYVKGLSTPVSISDSEQDSLTYFAAENVYLSGDCERSKISFAKYIERFPNGNFMINAQYYKGDCNYRNGDLDQALVAFNYVISSPRNIFSEQALLGAARINYNAKRFGDAAQNYKMLEAQAQVRLNVLEARIGQMRAYYSLKDYTQAIDACSRVLASEKVPDYTLREANFITAQSQFAQGNKDQALTLYRKVSSDVKTLEGAESKYHVAEILYGQGQTDKAQAEIFDFIDKTTPYQFWMAKSFILLADIYSRKKDNYQALQTLKSIIDGYELKDDGILDEAKAKKTAIDALEAPKTENIQDTVNLK
jgi:tetratricopeptide (TPR) repeat protein